MALSASRTPPTFLAWNVKPSTPTANMVDSRFGEAESFGNGCAGLTRCQDFDNQGIGQPGIPMMLSKQPWRDIQSSTVGMKAVSLWGCIFKIGQTRVPFIPVLVVDPTAGRRGAKKGESDEAVNVSRNPAPALGQSDTRIPCRAFSPFKNVTRMCSWPWTFSSDISEDRDAIHPFVTNNSTPSHVFTVPPMLLKGKDL